MGYYSKKVATTNTTADGTSGTRPILVTLQEDEFVKDLTFTGLGTNASASVARLWRAVGGGIDNADNNSLVGEATLTSTTVSQTAALTPVVLAIDTRFNKGDILFLTLGTGGGAGWHANLRTGDFYAQERIAEAQGGN